MTASRVGRAERDRDRRGLDWVRAGLFAPGEGRYHPTHSRSAGSRRTEIEGEVPVAFLSDLHGVPFPDGRQESYERGDRERIPAHLVPDLMRRGHILILEDGDE